MPLSVESLGPYLPLGDWVEIAVDWLQTHVAWLWHIVSVVIGGLTSGVHGGLHAVPPILLVMGFAALAWWASGRGVGLFTLLAFLLIDAMGFWASAMVTLGMIVVATLAAVVIGMPLGLLAGRYASVSAALRPGLDFMQTMPPFVYLIPAIFFFQIGVVPGVISTLVFAMPPAIRLTELGIRQVPHDLVEAGQAFGSTPNQVLFKIQFPVALPTIMAGVNQVIMLALSMAVIAGMVGAGGLGADVIRSLSTLDIGLGFESGLGVVILAVFLDRLTEGLSHRLAHTPAEE